MRKRLQPWDVRSQRRVGRLRAPHGDLGDAALVTCQKVEARVGRNAVQPRAEGSAPLSRRGISASSTRPRVVSNVIRLSSSQSPI